MSAQLSDQFTKSYQDQNYKYTTMVRHKGVVIAFAMNDKRQIFYTVLNLTEKEGQSPLDVNHWSSMPLELHFPNEISEVGVGIAGQTLLPVVRKGSRTPVARAVVVPQAEQDHFLSSTARFTADAPFQALSDGRHIFIFRQAIDADHDDRVFTLDKDGVPVKDANGKEVPLVNSTLLVDRFILSGTTLQTKMEVRYQRSRNKTTPQSRKDSLGAKDLDEKPFFEPTQELRFVRGLQNGRFTVLLLPTGVAGVQRWQIFAHNSKTGQMDAYNVERAADGLFNTRGSQEPNFTGYAESALAFVDSDWSISLGGQGVPMGQTFTQEAWIYPTSNAEMQALIPHGGSAPALYLLQGRAVRAGFSDEENRYEFVTGQILKLNTWQHLAVTCDGTTYRVYVDGKEKHRASKLDLYVADEKQGQVSLTDKKPSISSTIRSLGSADGRAMTGTLDEIRLWQRARSQAEIQADLHQRLTGLEPGLVGYWRFDEASGDRVHDQTDFANHGTVQGGSWVTSSAPIGENAGLSRNSFDIADRTIASGPTALLYYPQETTNPSNPQERTLKRSARVMFAVATQAANGGKGEIAVLDLGVAKTGRLAQIPDRLPLRLLEPPKHEGKTVAEQLLSISELEGTVQDLRTGIVTLNREISTWHGVSELLLGIIANRTVAPIEAAGFDYLNRKVEELQKARSVADQKRAYEQTLLDEPSNALIHVYEHKNYEGSWLRFRNRGFIGYETLNQHSFNDHISSLKISPSLQVTVYEDAGGGGKSATFTEDTPYVGDEWNDRISSLVIGDNPKFADELAAATKARADADQKVVDQTEVLKAARNTLLQEKEAKAQEKAHKAAELTTKQTKLQQQRNQLERGQAVAMALIATDPAGLSVTGGLLGFAWSQETPLLFDSATGQLALYFRGADDQFFVTYYATKTQRAEYALRNEAGQTGVSCFARSTDAEMDGLEISLAGDDPATCTVTITGPKLAGEESQVVETWQAVPRAPEQFARVLNGTANERAFVGVGTLITAADGSQQVEITTGVRRKLAQGATLLLDWVRLQVSEAVNKGATLIPVTSAALNPPTEPLPLFVVEYDYVGLAQTTKIPADLRNGSLFMTASAVPNQSRPLQSKQAVTSGVTLVGKWSAATPGYTLTFDGATSCAQAGTTPLAQFAAPDDLTLEAWVRPQNIDHTGMVIAQQCGDSGYLLGLERKAVKSALRFNGVNNAIRVEDDRNLLNFAGEITLEVWIKPPRTTEFLPIISHGPDNQRELYLGIRDRNYEVGVRDGASFYGAHSSIPESDQRGSNWVHLAGVYDGMTWRLYRNGEEVATKNSSVGAVELKGDWGIGRHGTLISNDDKLFNGDIDEVRIWQRACTAQEIAANKNCRLRGDEIGMVGYWHFEGEIKYPENSTYTPAVVPGYARGIPCLVYGTPTQLVSPIPYYHAYAAVGDKVVQTQEPFAGDQWTHLAAVYQQSYALEFDDRQASYLDCGNDITLDLTGDLTIEVGLQVADTTATRGILTRGQIDDGTDQNTPYALWIEGSQLVFAFEDTDQVNRIFRSNTDAITAKTFHRLAVTRHLRMETTADGKVKRWYDIKFYKAAEGIGSAEYWVQDDEKGLDSHDDFYGKEPGSSNGDLEIGRAFVADQKEARFEGVISEVRLWNVARPAESINNTIKGSEKGLVSWWRLEENEGAIAFDAKSTNHGKFRGLIKWVKNPEAAASGLTFYRDGVSVATTALTPTPPAQHQFTIGALQNTDGTLSQFFQGELEEVRIWHVARTQEQIQDNLFGRLQGEKEELIAYYTFDPSADANADATVLVDSGLRGNQLKVQGSDYIFSTAPIGEDTPQVRNALAGIPTTFHDRLQSQPAIQEYGDMQYDADNNLIGILKRCYALIKDGQWQLITGFKVGNLATEWIGQVQTAPQLFGYIEGAPPVPSENLTVSGYVLGELVDYQGASSVELSEAQQTTYTYTAEKESGFDMSVEGKLGVLIGTAAEAFTGPVITKLASVENVIGLHFQFENSLGWLESASTSTAITTTKTNQMKLRGSVENVDAIAYPYPKVGRRYVPDNLGYALVQSATADVFALRLQHTGALVSYQMRPNPDIPTDWNILTFPINRQYTKQGVLDGKVALDADPDFPNASNYSPDSSYFKPLEAYALKNRIQREEELIRTYYQQYDAGKIGRRQKGGYGGDDDLAGGGLLKKMPKVSKRNLVNTYVWTADGGLFAETQETMDVRQESFGGSYAFKGMAGAYTDLYFMFGGVGLKLELDALFGGHLNLTVNKSAESTTSFGLNVALDNVEGDLYLRDKEGNLVMDESDRRNPKPQKWPGKVDAYRFMTFYLEPKVEHFDLFFGKVVDPIWLEQSVDPNAAALRKANHSTEKPACWRMMHRVTFVSRILPEFTDTTAPPLERDLKALDIDSNYELIKLLEPFVINKLSHYADFAQAIHTTLEHYHPELKPHAAAIIQYMSLYYGISDDRAQQANAGLITDEFSNEGAPLDLVVDAGPPAQTIGVYESLPLQGLLRYNQQPPENYYITWRQLSGPAAAAIHDAHDLTTTATFSERGVYRLQLMVNDGLLGSSDEIEVRVNRQPQVVAGTDQEIPRNGVAQLRGWLDDGLADPQPGAIKVNWSVVNGTGKVKFANEQALQTTATFTHSGAYLLRLTADNGSFTASDEVLVTVAGRVTRNLQALYAFAEGGGGQVRDVAAIQPPLSLVIPSAAKVSWNGGLVLQAPTTLLTAQAPTRLVDALKQSHELTVESWIKPATASQNGLARIVTLAKGPGERNFILGQRGNQYYVGVRTTDTDKNASDRALAAGSVTTNTLTHLVCTRTASGQLQLYIDGNLVGQRLVSGTFEKWGTDFLLALGNEVGQNGSVDRAWAGEFHLVALYNRALTPAEVQQNFEFGADTNLPPLVLAGPDQTINTLTTQLQGAVLDEGLLAEKITNVQWSQANGPTSVAFANPKALNTQATFHAPGRYELRLTVSDGELVTSDEVAIIVNTPPQINAGNPQWLIHSAPTPATTRLQGEINNTGVGNGAAVKKITWSKRSGPGDVTFTNAQALDSEVSFKAAGKYELQLAVDNGYFPPVFATTTIFVNKAPVIQASASAVLITLPASATLTGKEVDLGLADPDGKVERRWEKVSGPGNVTFAAEKELDTTASFTQSGVYVLKLIVTTISSANQRLTSEAKVNITANQPPVVDAGPDQQIVLTAKGKAQVELEGSVSDDGLPEDPGKVTTCWSMMSGPTDGKVDFENEEDVYTTARFTKAGKYVLQLTAKDYDKATPVGDTVTITVS